MIGITILLKLIIAHLLGDFVFQTSKIASDKSKLYFPLALWKHLLIHLICIYVLFLFDIETKIVAVIISSHFIIDLTKTWIGKKINQSGTKLQLENSDWRLQRKRVFAFLGDQAAHLTVLVFCWIWHTKQWELFSWHITLKGWIIILAYIIVIWPTSIFISMWVKRWEDDFAVSYPDKTIGLLNAGKWIGIIERTLILTFIFSNSFASIGFLLAAKSILRIGDKDEHKKTEYILIGTLLSAGITIVTGLLASYVISMLNTTN